MTEAIGNLLRRFRPAGRRTALAAPPDDREEPLMVVRVAAADDDTTEPSAPPPEEVEDPPPPPARRRRPTRCGDCMTTCCQGTGEVASASAGCVGRACCMPALKIIVPIIIVAIIIAVGLAVGLNASGMMTYEEQEAVGRRLLQKLTAEALPAPAGAAGGVVAFRVEWPPVAGADTWPPPEFASPPFVGWLRCHAVADVLVANLTLTAAAAESAAAAHWTIYALPAAGDEPLALAVDAHGAAERPGACTHHLLAWWRNGQAIYLVRELPGDGLLDVARLTVSPDAGV